MEHRLILGGEQFLPFARSCVAKLKKLGLPYASQSFDINGASVKVRIEPGHEYITLRGGSDVYEFFTTGPVLAIDDSLGFDAYRGYSVFVEVDAKRNKLNGKPAGSTLERSAADPPKWRFSPYATDMWGLMPHKGWQIQGTPEHQYFPSLKPPIFLESVWTGASQVNRLAPRGTNHQWPFVADVGYDTAPSIFRAPGSPAGRSGLAPDADWYRRAAMRRVEHPEHGARTFILMTDATNHLHVYPTTERDYSLADTSPYQDQAIKTNVPSSVTRSMKLPLPGWARTSTSMARDNFPNVPPTGSIIWEFNSTATRMVSVLPSDLGVPVYGDTKDDLTLAGKPVPAQEALAGLVEFAVNVVITGPQAGDFTVDLTITDEVNPASGVYVIAADYYWGDLPEATEPGPIARDSLLYMTVDIYHNHPEPSPPPEGQSEAGFTAMRAQAKVKRRSDESVLREFPMLCADAPYGHDGVAYAGSFLQAYRAKAALAATELSNPAYLHDGTTTALTKTFTDDANAFVAAHPLVSCESLAQFDRIVQKYLDDMRDYARGAEYIWGTEKTKKFINEVFRYKFYLSHMLGLSKNLITLKSQILAYDLRVMAFAVQTAAFRNIGNQTTRQDRLQIIMRNQLVETKNPPDQWFADAASSYDAAWEPPPGWARLAPTRMGNPSKSIQVFRSLVSESQGYWTGADPVELGFGAIPHTRSDSDTDYPVGAVEYNFCAQSFLSMWSSDTFCIHPSGHWAISTIPVVYYAGPSTHYYGFSLVEPPGVDASQFVQQTLDVVNIRVTKKVDGVDAVKDFRTTHLALFNQAYEKTTTPEDFYFTFDSYTLNHQYVKSQVARGRLAGKVTPVLFSTSVFGTLVGSETQGVLGYVAPSYLCMRDLSYADQFTDIVPGDIVWLWYRAVIRAAERQAVARGSCLFTGELVQR